MQAVVAPALARYREALPGVALRTAPFAEALRLLENGEGDLRCGGADPGRPLPAFLRRGRFLELTSGIVAGEPAHQPRFGVARRRLRGAALRRRRGCRYPGSRFQRGESRIPASGAFIAIPVPDPEMAVECEVSVFTIIDGAVITLKAYPLASGSSRY